MVNVFGVTDFNCLQNKFQVLGRLYIFVHVLKELLRCDTGIDLRGSYIRVPQHPADGFNRHSGFQRNQRGEGVTCLMEYKVKSKS